ncbi:hypothetical protein VPH35_083060 [Triticum aestivum]
MDGAKSPHGLPMLAATTPVGAVSFLGRCHGPDHVPPRAPGETLVPALRNRRRRRHGVVTFMKAPPWLLAESSELEFGASCFWCGLPLGTWASRALCMPSRRILRVFFFRPG